MQMGIMINKHGTMYVTRKKEKCRTIKSSALLFISIVYMQMIGQTNLHV